MRSALAVLALVALSNAAHAQSSAFVITVGRDTIAVERFTHSPTHLEAELTTRGMGPRLKYAVDYVNGMPGTMRNAAYSGAADSTLLQNAVLTFRGDSVIVDITSQGRTVTQRIGTETGAFPIINPSFALFEPVIARARALGADPATIPLFTVSGGRTFPVTVSFVGSDTAVLTIAGVEMRLAVAADHRIMGAVVPSQNLQVTRVAGAAALEEVKRDYTAPADARYTAEDVTIPAGNGATLGGTLTLPKQRKGRVPVVVTISGSGLQDRDEALPIVSGYRPFRQIAEALAARGIGVLRYDDRGFGASTGNVATATSADFAEDTRFVVAWLRTRPDVDGRNLFLLGHSEGGIIAPLVGAQDRELRGIVLMAGPSRTGRRILEYQTRFGIDAQRKFTVAQRDSLYAAIPAQLDSLAKQQPWMRYFMSYDPLPTARQVKVPVLILQGANDRQVTADQAPELAAAFRAGGNKDVTVHVVPGVNHLFIPDADGSPAGYSALPDRKVAANVVALITDWISDHVR